MPSTFDAWFAQLAPEVAAYRSGYFQLGPELRRLYAVREADATEAIVFYGARMLEALSADAVLAVGMEASESVFSNLELLERHSLLARGPLYSAHALRRLGNSARHIQEELTAQHAELSLALTEHVLEWFFYLNLPRKARLKELCDDERGLRLAADETLRASLKEAEDLGRTWSSSWADLGAARVAELLRTGQAPAIIAEMWLDRGRVDAAGELLRDALARHRNDLRLQQLELLVVSRKGDLDAARRQIDQLLARKSDDEETLGIAAGAYKRLWKRDAGDQKWLKASHDLYRAGWKKSKQQNAYLGINAATTALWIGRSAESRQLAADVARLLSGRAERLGKCGCPEIRADFWTQVSLAEALLLQGELAPASAAYRAAFEQFPDNQGAIQVAGDQLQAIAQALGIPRHDVEPLLT